MAGLAARRDAAPFRCLVQARRTERAAGPLRQPVRRPGGADALARRATRDSRPAGGLARARAGGRVREHEGQRGTPSFPPPGSSRATPHSSAGAPQAPDARSSAAKSLPPTTPGRPAGTTRHAHLAPLLSPEPMNAVGWAARRGPVSIDMGLFRAASLQTQRARFPGTELSSDLCRVCDAGLRRVP